jgi:hypothetical protein
MTELSEAVVGENGVLSLYLKAEDGSVSTIRLSERAQALVLQALLASSLDPLTPSSRRFHPAGLSRFRIADEVGLSFLFSKQMGIHVVLDRSLADSLRELLATFDDPSTWRAARLN